MTFGGMSPRVFRAWLGQVRLRFRRLPLATSKDDPGQAGKQKVIKIKSMNRQLSDDRHQLSRRQKLRITRHDHVKLPSNKLVVDFRPRWRLPRWPFCRPSISNIPPTLVRHESELLSFFAAATVLICRFGLGEVGFEFPVCAEPCLPVSTDFGLLYPRTGIQLRLPELTLAKSGVPRSFYVPSTSGNR